MSRINEINNRLDELDNMEMMIVCAEFLTNSDKELLQKIRQEQAELQRKKEMMEIVK